MCVEVELRRNVYSVWTEICNADRDGQSAAAGKLCSCRLRGSQSLENRHGTAKEDSNSSRKEHHASQRQSLRTLKIPNTEWTPHFPVPNSSWCKRNFKRKRERKRTVQKTHKKEGSASRRTAAASPFRRQRPPGWPAKRGWISNARRRQHAAKQRPCSPRIFRQTPQVEFKQTFQIV